MKSINLADATTAVRELTGYYRTNEFVDDTEIHSRLYDAVEELWQQVADQPGGYDFLGKRATVSGTGPILAYPSDFRTLERVLPGDGVATDAIRRLQATERAAAIDADGPLSLVIEYLPSFDRSEWLVGTAYTFLDGWDKYVTNDTAAQVLAQAKRDSAEPRMRADKALSRILAHAILRDRAETEKVRDVRFGVHDSIFDTTASDLRYKQERAGIRFFRVGYR